MNTIKLDFEQAKAKHLLFKSRLRSLLYGGEVDETPIVSERECSVGKWIYGHALQDYGHLPQMQELEQVHADLHVLARKLVELYKNGKQEEARGGLVQMEELADRIVGLLTTLEENIMSKHSHGKNSHESDELEVSLKEFNDLLKANEQLDKVIKNQVLTQEQTQFKYKTVFNSIDQAFCIIEVMFDENNKPYDYLFLDVNSAFEEQTGIKDAEGKTIRELTPNIENYWPEIYGKIVLTGESRRFKEGSEALNRWFDVNAFRIGGENSRQVAIIFSDITEKRTAEQALQKQIQATSHERKILHDFFMQAPAGFCILNGPEHVFELANQDYLQLVGNRNVIGKKVREALPEVEGQGFFELLDKVYSTGEPFIGKEIEIMIDKGNGPTPLYVNFIYQAYKDMDGNSAGILVFVYDITEQVQARKELQQAYDDLEIKVMFRNIELERLNKEKSERIAELENQIEQLRTQKA